MSPSLDDLRFWEPTLPTSPRILELLRLKLWTIVRDQSVRNSPSTEYRLQCIHCSFTGRTVLTDNFWPFGIGAYNNEKHFPLHRTCIVDVYAFTWSRRRYLWMYRCVSRISLYQLTRFTSFRAWLNICIHTRPPDIWTCDTLHFHYSDMPCV